MDFVHSWLGHVALLAVIGAVGACGDRGDKSAPEAQQLARINRELAALEETVATLHARLDRLDTEHAHAGSKTHVQPDHAAPANASEALNLVVTNAPKAPYYRIDGQPVSDAALERMLREYAARVTQPELRVESGADVPYARVVRVMELSRAVGIERVSLRHDAPETP